MCDVTRRSFLAAHAAAFLSANVEQELLAGAPRQAPAPPGVQQVAPDVYFFQGKPDAGLCNSGWVILDDYVLVIDANYPAGARELIRAIRTLTDKPIRFAFDTHHHGDHAYGNQVFAEEGATAVAHTGVLDEMKRLETGYFGGPPGRWEQEASNREDVRTSRLKPPSVLFPRELFFDDGRHRVELVHFGVAHTKGDAFAWLPTERILFSGDAVVNGPYNFVGDGNVASWIETLDGALKLKAEVLCPGHGARGTAAVIADQQAFFRRLVELVDARLTKIAPEAARREIESLRTAMQREERIARYVGDSDGFAAQVEKVYEEVAGRPLAAAPKAARHARLAHARAHGHA